MSLYLLFSIQFTVALSCANSILNRKLLSEYNYLDKKDEQDCSTLQKTFYIFNPAEKPLEVDKCAIE